MWTNGYGMDGTFMFHGALWLWLSLLAVIFMAMLALVRDRRHDRREDAALDALYARCAKAEASRDDYTGPGRDQ